MFFPFVLRFVRLHAYVVLLFRQRHTLHVNYNLSNMLGIYTDGINFVCFFFLGLILFMISLNISNPLCQQREPRSPQGNDPLLAHNLRYVFFLCSCCFLAFKISHKSTYSFFVWCVLRSVAEDLHEIFL